MATKKKPARKKTGAKIHATKKTIDQENQVQILSDQGANEMEATSEQAQAWQRGASVSCAPDESIKE